MSNSIGIRTYQLGRSQLTLRFGDITSSEAQVLVSSDDNYLSMGGGVSAAILAAGGNAIALDSVKRVPARLGEVVVTAAGTLPAQYIFHAVTIENGVEGIDGAEIVQRTTKRCLQLLATLDLRSIAFPAIGSGAAGFRFEDVATNMAEVICDEVLKLDKMFDVTIYLFDRYGKMAPIDFLRFFEEFAARVPRLKPSAASGEQRTIAQEPSTQETGSSDQSPQDVKARRLHGLNKLINKLEEHRLKIEEDLVSALANNDEEPRQKVASA